MNSNHLFFKLSRFFLRMQIRWRCIVKWYGSYNNCEWLYFFGFWTIILFESFSSLSCPSNIKRLNIISSIVINFNKLSNYSASDVLRSWVKRPLYLLPLAGWTIIPLQIQKPKQSKSPIKILKNQSHSANTKSRAETH